jgi:N utilization substance protein B
VADDVIERTIETMDVDPPARTWLRDSVKLAWDRHVKVDAIIEDLAIGWKLARIARVDLSILRLAIVELLLGFEDPSPPDPVVINEAVVLAKKFSTDDSGKFVNGILATVVKDKDKFLDKLSEDE